MILLDPKYTKLIVGALDLIREELDRLYWNKYHKEMNSPFDNSGETYSNDTFTVKAYDWVNNNDDSPNFNYKNIYIFIVMIALLKLCKILEKKTIHNIF